MTRAVIIQPNYISWKGYFDLIASADECILYDTVQYTKQDWRNRNYIKMPGGRSWLTIPVKYDRTDQRICETTVADQRWTEKHVRRLANAYRSAEHFQWAMERLEPLYAQCAGEISLSRINALFIRSICEWLGITTIIHPDPQLPRSGKKNDDLIALCRHYGVTCYISGQRAKNYFNDGQWQDSGIGVEWMHYDGYPEYRQFHPPFCHEVSIVDTLFHLGADTPRYMLFGKR